MKRIVIVGSGISGLTAAYELKKRLKEKSLPVEVTILDKSERLGGVFITERVNGFLVEGGPDSFEIYKPSPLELANELGIGTQVISANEELHRNFIYANNELQEIPSGLLGLVPKKISSLILCPLLSWKARLRASLELITPPLKSYGADLSLGEFYKRRFGQETFELIAEPLFGSIYACIPETISIQACWPRGLAMEKEYGSLVRAMLAKRKELKKEEKSEEAKQQPSIFFTFKNGMSQLTDALIEHIGQESFITGKEVETLTRDSKDNRFHIQTKDGDHIKADVCIMATAPSYSTSRIFKSLDPAISDMLLRIPYVSSATISLGYEKKGFPHPLDGFGLLVARAENKHVKAVTWSSTKFAGRAPDDKVLIRCFVGNAQEETIVYRSDEEILKAVQEDLKEIMGIDVEPIMTRLYRWPNSMAQYTLGHTERVAFIEERMRRYPGLFLASNAYRGLGIGDCINIGRQAAGQALEYLNSRGNSSL